MTKIDGLTQEAIALAEAWQIRANALMNREEKARHRRMARLLAEPVDKVFLVKLIDQSFRSRNMRRVADQIHSLLIEHGIPKFFSPLETVLMCLFVYLGRYLPFDNKLDVDANYKRMVEFGMRPENINAVRLGIASHNVFDLADAYVTAKQNKVFVIIITAMVTWMSARCRLRMNFQLAKGEQALVRLRRIEHPTSNIELKEGQHAQAIRSTRLRFAGSGIAPGIPQ
jgi:proline dehydrogenase